MAAGHESFPRNSAVLLSIRRSAGIPAASPRTIAAILVAGMLPMPARDIKPYNRIKLILPKVKSAIHAGKAFVSNLCSRSSHLRTTLPTPTITARYRPDTAVGKNA